jgi:hypothetical protein
MDGRAPGMMRETARVAARRSMADEHERQARGGSGRHADGSKRAIQRAGSDVLHEGHLWARKVSAAQRGLRQAVDRGADDDVVAERRRAVLMARADDAKLRASVDALERQVVASPEPDAEWTRGARVEVERVRAGLEGRPDPTGGAPGIQRGWRDLPPVITIAIAAWIVIAVVVAAVVIRGL